MRALHVFTPMSQGAAFKEPARELNESKKSHNLAAKMSSIRRVASATLTAITMVANNKDGMPVRQTHTDTQRHTRAHTTHGVEATNTYAPLRRIRRRSLRRRQATDPGIAPSTVCEINARAHTRSRKNPAKFGDKNQNKTTTSCAWDHDECSMRNAQMQLLSTTERSETEFATEPA